jgi:hypothetical protein
LLTTTSASPAVAAGVDVALQLGKRSLHVGSGNTRDSVNRHQRGVKFHGRIRTALANQDEAIRERLDLVVAQLRRRRREESASIMASVSKILIVISLKFKKKGSDAFASLQGWPLDGECCAG